MTDDMRREFEAWLNNRPDANKFWNLGVAYWPYSFQVAWEAWQHATEAAQAETDRLRAAIEAMRVAGGAAEFQAAFDKAKNLIRKQEDM